MGDRRSGRECVYRNSLCARRKFSMRRQSLLFYVIVPFVPFVHATTRAHRPQAGCGANSSTGHISTTDTRTSDKSHKPSSVRPGCSSGRLPCGHLNKRSASSILTSLILAKRTCILPFSSNSQFSFPYALYHRSSAPLHS